MAHTINNAAIVANGLDLERDLEWLAQLLSQRLNSYFAKPSTSPCLPDSSLPPPELDPRASPYAAFLHEHDLSPAERAVVVLALTPHLRPQLLDALWIRNDETQRGFAEFGGVESHTHGAFLPTGETALFLLVGDDIRARLLAARLLAPDGKLASIEAVRLSDAAPHAPAQSGHLQAHRRLLSLITTGHIASPPFDQHFPARRIETNLEWSDLVLPPATLEQLEEIRDWLTHGRTLLEDWGMGRRIRPGYTSLFCGPPGTGKTLTACLLGKLCRCEVYRIDLSMIVSKYIGETEKNLARVFDQAEHRGWILFFDEADALFGKRTRVEDSHDRYANQEVSFLLQRIEDFNGVVILATNLRANIDDAFLRRFESVVQFQMPRPAERLRIWRDALPSTGTPAPTVESGLDLLRLAERHELSGGTIVNVVRYTALKALARGDQVLRAHDVEDGIRRELEKEGRAF